MRITLAHWHAGRAPGAEVDVTDEELRQLQRDGRVATVPSEEEEPTPEPQPETEPEPEHQAAEAEPEPVSEKAPPPSRRKR